MTRIGILGAGTMADALGTQWIRTGHEVMVSGRDPARVAAAAEKMGARAGGFAEAAGFGAVTLLAVTDTAVPAVLAAAGGIGGPLVDCTNPVVPGDFTLATDGRPSMAERVAAAAPDAQVVKAFNLCHEDVWRMTPPAFDGVPLAVPLCGDDEAALAAVRALVADLGCVPVDGGGLARAGLLEATMAFMVPLWLAGVDARGVLPPLAYAFGEPEAQLPRSAR
ncbi:NAD(P)-binding domain-containing protein [Streptomyces sp. A7024]|uniref:NAD(P)-binding domain-containing protein n=1 Tax=Streptomyces coryli TaxID=1128680 RepID=A0A6G4UBC5_9ACTN|nr:NAD(P)-binding domain-containing protein [Streptomyces coryli]NGN69474.1 NAD(P)-binding domain-containing protein [Streptomyces coryli]